MKDTPLCRFADILDTGHGDGPGGAAGAHAQEKDEWGSLSNLQVIYDYQCFYLFLKVPNLSMQ